MSVFEKYFFFLLIFNNIFIIHCILFNIVFEVTKLNIFNDKKKKNLGKENVTLYTKKI